MSRLNMVRKIKDAKKDPMKVQDNIESIREKGWDHRFIYNKLEDNIPEKRPIPKKAKNDYSSNINYLKEQFGGDNLKKSNKKRGKSGYKFYHENKININNNNKNKIKINSNNNLKQNNNIKGNNINNTGENKFDVISLLDEKKLRYTNNNYKIINRNNNSADYNNNNNNINLNNPNSVNKSNNSSTVYNMALNELDIHLGILWNKLGVKSTFQKTFNKLKEDMENEEAKREFTIMEIENLERLEKFLQKLSLEIENRDKAILLLKKLIEVIEKQFVELNLDIRESILRDFYQTIIGYRINTIIVVESISSYNQIFSHSVNKGKFNEEYLFRKYKLFDLENPNSNENYLLKIKNDLNFLGNSKVNGYKQLNLYFNSNSDPFLLNVAEQIPIDIDYYNRIKQCQYIIMQEVIFDEINQEIGLNKSNMTEVKESNKKKKLEPINQNNSKILNNNNSNVVNNNYKIVKKEKDNIACVDKKENIKINNSVNNNISINDKNKNLNIKENSNYTDKKNEKIEIGAQLIDRNNYENFFGTKNLNENLSEEKELEELKKEFNIIQNLKNKKKTSNKNIIENKSINETKDNNEAIIKEENNKIKDNYKEKNEKENKEITITKKDNIINNEKKKSIDDNEIKGEIEINQTIKNNENKNAILEYKEEKKENENKNAIQEYKEETNKEEKEEITKKDSKNIDKKKDEKKTNKNLEDKDNNDDLVNLDENININEEKLKTKHSNQNKDNNINNKDNNIDENILENSLVISKNTKNSQEKSRSATPKSKRGEKIISIKEAPQNKDNNISNIKKEINIHQIKDNDYIAFYCGKISNFISIYSAYYNTIPEEQKLIFNLKSNPLEYLYNNIYPKIIIYSDKKTKHIKGLCIFSHIYTNEAKNNALYIEHISSYNEEDRENILEKLLNFIKENSENIFGFENGKKDKDIYIDLYYKSEDGKFTINTQIRDFFRNQLKFKWVKLENLSKYVRFQKMRHQFMINNNDNNLLNNEYDDNNILNQSILGRKEFGDDDNNESDNDNEEESEDDEINMDISTIFDSDKNYENNKTINNNKKNEIHPFKNINLLNNFIIKNKTILKFKNKSKNNTKKNNSKTYIKYSNPFNLIYLLHKLKENQNITYNNLSPNINSYFNKKDSDIINQILSKCYLNKKTILLENNYYYSDTNKPKKTNKNKFKINSNINILPIFDKCISFKYNNYYYNRIETKKLQTFIERETKQIFYIINKTDNHIILMSSSLKDNFKQKYICKENNDNISINFMAIYNNLIDKENKNKNILYIPAFEIKCKFVNNCYTNINKDDKKSNLYSYEDYYNIKFFTEELMCIKNKKNMKKNINYNACMNFDFDLFNETDIEEDNFINDNFLIVVLNLNVIDEIRALPLITLYVTKDNFITNK